MTGAIGIFHPNLRLPRFHSITRLFQVIRTSEDSTLSGRPRDLHLSPLCHVAQIRTQATLIIPIPR